MKKILIFVFFGIQFVCCYSDELQKYEQKLESEETIEYKIIDNQDNKDKYDLELYATDTKRHKRLIYKKSGYSFYIHDGQNPFKKKKAILFSVISQKGEQDKPYICDLYYFNGIQGILNKLYSSTNFIYELNYGKSIICIYDYEKSTLIPTIDFYTFPGMELLKTVVVQEMKNKHSYPDSLVFQDEEFIIELSNDGPDYKKISIPIK